MLCCLFVLLDIAVIGALATFATRRQGKIGDLTHGLWGMYGATDDFDGAYDPYVWMTLVPLDAFTLLVNLYLGLKEHCCSKKERYRMSKLMIVILRDNIIYLIL